MRQSRKCASSRRSIACPTEVLQELLLVGESWRRALFDVTTSILHRSEYGLLTSRGDPLIELRRVGRGVVGHRRLSVPDCDNRPEEAPLSGRRRRRNAVAA